MNSHQARVWGLVAAAAFAVLAMANADAQTLRGAAGIQYERDRQFSRGIDLESWLSSFRADHAGRFRQIEILSQFQISEQHLSGRPERSLLPQFTVRLAHPVFGVYGSYRPTSATDFNSVTSRRQEALVNAYFQKPLYPLVNASWARTRLDPGNGTTPLAGVTRSVSASYGIGRLGLHAAYGDEARDRGPDQLRTSDRTHFDYGAAAHFERRNANAQFQYEFTQAKRDLGAGVYELSRLHAGSANGSLRLSPKTTAGLGYNIRYSDSSRPGTSSVTDHEGSMSLAHQWTKAIQISGGGGVRTAQFGDRTENEGYVIASITADGDARPGWRMNAGLSQSLNWLPNEHARPISMYRLGTVMKLADGLAVNGDASLSSTKAVGDQAESLGTANQITMQTGAGIRAVPLRSVMFNGNVVRYRPQAPLHGESQTLTFWSANLDWHASTRFLATAGWSFTDAASDKRPDQTLWRGSGQWSASRRLQVNGTYNRITQQVHDPTLAAQPIRESYAAWLAWAVNRDLSARVQYNEVDPGRPTHTRQVVASATQNFGR
jgi:hypothetical protein